MAELLDKIFMPTQIQLRRGNAATWTSINPILSEGEIGYELDTHYSKIGNGASVWTALPYLSASYSLTSSYANTSSYVSTSNVKIVDGSLYILSNLSQWWKLSVYDDGSGSVTPQLDGPY